MRVGLVQLAALIVVPMSATAQSGTTNFAYSPGTQHYKWTTEVHREQMQGGGRAPFEFDVTTTQMVTVHITPRSADTLNLEVTLDSVGVETRFDAPPPDTHDLIGAKLTGVISPQGHVYSFDPPPGTTDPQLIALYRAFRQLLLSMPNKPLTVGTTWSDTTKERVHKNGFDVMTREIITSRVAGDTTVEGQHAWRIVRHAEIVQSGRSNAQQDTVQLFGDGSMNAVHLLGANGVYLGSQSTQRISLTMKNAVSESAPISQVIKTSVTRVPGGA